MSNVSSATRKGSTPTNTDETFFKVRQLEELSNEKKDEKSIRQIRIRHSDFNRSDPSILDQGV